MDENALCGEWRAYALYVGRRVGGTSPDVDSDALLGLLKACRSFDPSRGAAFKTYLTQRVRGEVLDGLRDRGPLTRADLERVKAGVEVPFQERVSLEALREEVGFDAVDDDTSLLELAREAALRRRVDALFRYASLALAPREYEALVRHYRDGERLKAIGESWSVSESRVCQILKAAEARLARGLTAPAA